MKLLTLDIGNTNVKAGLFEDNIISQTGKFAADDSLQNNLSSFKFDSCAISSVVPSVTLQIKSILEKDFGINPFIITNKSVFSISNKYKTPETLGIDRICCAEGAIKFLSKSNNFSENDFIMTVDFGTATTINIVEYPSVFLGGAIAPGIKLMIDALNRDTAQLPRIDIKDYEDVIGTSTNTSIASGVVNSVRGMVEQLIDYLQDVKSANNIYIFITGGNAQSIKPFFNFNYFYEPDLILHGINSIYLLNNFPKADK